MDDMNTTGAETEEKKEEMPAAEGDMAAAPGMPAEGAEVEEKKEEGEHAEGM